VIAKDIMTIGVVTISPDAAIQDAINLLLDRHISGVPVIDHDGKLCGMLTEGDLMRRVERLGGQSARQRSGATSPEAGARAFAKSHGRRVRDVMTKDVVTVDDTEPVDRIAFLLESRGIKRVPVLHDGKMVGIISRANLLRALASGPATGPGSKDPEIRMAILNAVKERAGDRAAMVDVTVANGIAHLWGNVETDAERDAIRVIAENTAGIRDIQDHIRLLPGSDFEYEPD
jgi:CBS domain-containing protein